MTARENHLSWRTRLAKSRGVKIAGRVGTRILDFIIPVQEKTYRQRESLIRYRQSLRFHDPIHGVHTDSRPVPHVRILQIGRVLDRLECQLRVLFEEKIPHPKK